MLKPATNLIEFPPNNLPIPAPIRLQPKVKAAPKKQQTHMDMPEACLYGTLGVIAKCLGLPIAWAYAAVLGIYSALNAWCIQDDDPHSRSRANIYIAIMGDVASGKSLVIDRAIRALNPEEHNIIRFTPASDRGLYEMFTPPKDAPPGVPACVLALDELRDLMQKLAIQGSSLPMALCSLFNLDKAGSYVKKSLNDAIVRLSIIGALKISDAADFERVMGRATGDGLYTRFILMPPPATAYKIRQMWSYDGPPPDLKTKVRLKQEDYDAIDRWEEEYKALGYAPIRIAETTLRVAILTAAANGETTISPACMQAALEFAAFQAKVKYGYQPGEAIDDDAEFTGVLLRTMRDQGQENAKPKRVKFYLLVKDKSWNRKYGASRVTRVKEALIKQGTLNVERGEDGKPLGTAWVWLNAEEFEGEQS